MHEYMPLLIVGAIIGVFSVIFLIARIRLQSKLKAMTQDRNMSDKVIIRRLLRYGRPYLKQFILVLVISISRFPALHCPACGGW